MEVTLYLPYYDYNDGAFDVNNDYYDEDEYINAVSSEYNKNKDIIYNSVMDAKNGVGSLLQGGDGQTYKFGQKTSQSEDKVAYSKCNGTLYDIGGSKDTVDGFIEKFAAQKQFLEIVEFDLDTVEEEFETEISLWVKEHNNINSYADKLGEDWVLAKEPKRNIKLHFKNNANEDIFAVLEDCKIMDIIEDNSFILFVERITLIDNI
jgi:hypothetical protein